MKIKLALVSALMIMLACGNIKSDNMKTVTEQDNNGTVTVKLGTLVKIDLESNPTTGFQWSVVKVDDKVLALQGKPEMVAASHKDSKIVGAPGRQVFTFKPVAAGHSRVELAYARSWEKKEKPARTFAVTVEVAN